MTTIPKMLACLAVLILAAAANAATVNLPVRPNPLPERINRRPPIPFKPFELTDAQGKPIVDPRTGKVITRDTIVRLPNGKSITYGKWFDTLNALEQQNNALGYSLRQHKSRSQKVEIAETAVDRAKLDAQATQIRSMAKFSAASVTHASMTATARTHHAQARQKSAALRTPAMLAILGKVKAAGPGVNKHWDLPMGDRSSFYVDLNGSLQLSGSNTGTTMKVAGRADSAVLNNSFTLVSVDGTADSPLSEPHHVTFSRRGSNI